MAEFIVTETRPAWITWRFVVEAATEAEAIEMAQEGEIMDAAGYEIGDNLDSYDAEFDATPCSLDSDDGIDEDEEEEEEE